VALPDGGVDPEFAGCVEAGETCYQAARDAVAGKTIRRVYGYAVSETFGAGVLRCPALDRRIVSGGRTYYRLLLGDSCTADSFDLVLVATDGDGVGNLMTEAAGFGMKVYPGLPAAPQDPAKPWLPDLAHTKVLDALTERVLADYRQRFAALPSFAGVYQSFELSMKARPDDDPTIELYKAQNAVAAAALPGRKLLVSPYFDARRKQGFPPGLVAGGMADVAATRAGMPMIVAVQDGRGTGKGTVYQADQVDVKVDPRLVPVVGDVTNRQAYYGSTRDYIEAAARAVPAGVELWANIEAFEPTPASGECGRANPMPLRGRTTKARIDQQITAVGGYVGKIISYGWDPFFTCQPGWSTPSLSDDIAASWNQPIIVDAAVQPVEGQGGIEVKGYNLDGGTFTVSYRPAGGAPVRTETVRQESHRPGPLESAWAPFAPADLDPVHPWVSIAATNATGHTTAAPYVLPATG
jgi:hypothetical protein